MMTITDDPESMSRDEKVPKWLTISYVFWTLFGLLWLFIYWNGSWGWLDRGYWSELQRAANTTFPIENVNDQLENKESNK